MTLARAKRLSFGAAALLCFAAAIVLTPSSVRSQLTGHHIDAGAEPSPRAEASLAAVVPAGDAFAPRADSDEEPRPALSAPPPPLRLPQLPQTRVQSPNLVPPHPRITAIATGSNPSAIVEDGGTARIVIVGDPLAGSTISAIGDDGIRLTNGRRLSLEPGTPTP
jgi:hypothetical protein